ncbi:hypothetical protein DAPPUDRAFT_252536 [Daphnia pulex]|uniref:Uncharacterized protein n=1 Tax=Daphnia pulex TaxID=6669 RepID=E9H2X3_DAPPU|nr:hypothetical protein DAPPUDRAFT_252536 [Daphnia pulex]|eukprot:EFX73860.1 hypothetical protein DAPPUDRAFT_252536 [Daphnia pulex]
MLDRHGKVAQLIIIHRLLFVSSFRRWIATKAIQLIIVPRLFLVSSVRCWIASAKLPSS